MSSDAELIEKLAAGDSSNDSHLALIVSILRSHEHRLQSIEAQQLGCLALQSASSRGLGGACHHDTPGCAALAPNLGAEVHVQGAGSRSAHLQRQSAAQVAESRDFTLDTRAELGSRSASDKLERIQALNDLRDNLDARLVGLEAAFHDLASRMHERMEDIVMHVGQMMQQIRDGQKQ
jgi:hypothetical protein